MANLSSLQVLSQAELLVVARDVLRRQAAEIYAPEALRVVERIIAQSTAYMDRDQLFLIAAREAA